MQLWSFQQNGLAAAFAAALVLTGCDNGLAETVQAKSRALPAAASFSCTPIKLWDGDGPIHCAEGPKIRLAGIAAREVRWTGSEMIDAGCNEGHPCPKLSGVAARNHLARLLTTGAVQPASTGHMMLRGPTLSCVSQGSAGGSRTAAWCSSPRAGSLSCAMLKSGYALKWPRYWRDHRC